MDEYLKPNAAYERLLREYNKHGSLVIAVDVDSTLYDKHNKEESYEMVRQLVRDLHSIGCYIVIWTCNPDTNFIEKFLFENNIPYNTINEDAPHKKCSQTRKVNANAYLDDRSGLLCIYTDLKKLVREVKGTY